MMSIAMILPYGDESILLVLDKVRSVVYHNHIIIFSCSKHAEYIKFTRGKPCNNMLVANKVKYCSHENVMIV
jgi:hypothetical protein